MQASKYFSLEVIYSFRRLDALVNSRILWSEENLIYKNSVLTEILIHLKDLLIKASKMGNRIKFIDDVLIQEDQRIFDITDLISNFRDGYCHIDSYRKKHRNKAFSFIELRGKNILQFDSTIAGKYKDDIAYVLGGNLLYLKRHIERVYTELLVVLRDIVGQKIMNFALRTGYGS